MKFAHILIEFHLFLHYNYFFELSKCPNHANFGQFDWHIRVFQVPILSLGGQILIGYAHFESIASSPLDLSVCPLLCGENSSKDQKPKTKS